MLRKDERCHMLKMQMGRDEGRKCEGNSEGEDGLKISWWQEEMIILDIKEGK